MDDYIRLVNCVKSLRTQNLTWQEIGDKIGISRSLAWNVAHGKSDSVIARHYFGIPPKQVLVEPCRVCGEVHKLKTCNKKRKKQDVDRMAAWLSPDKGISVRKKLEDSGFYSITEYWEWFHRSYCE